MLILLRQVEFVLFAVRMSVVYRREKRPNGEDDCPQRRQKEIQEEIAKRMKLSVISDGRHSSVWKHFIYKSSEFSTLDPQTDG